jgi:hypothetical protein
MPAGTAKPVFLSRRVQLAEQHPGLGAGHPRVGVDADAGPQTQVDQQPAVARDCPWRIGAITAAALALLHHQHGRTT